MKPTSIIFLLISLAVILVGWIVCHSAEVSAAEQNVQLFDSVIDPGNDAVSSFTFGAEEIYNKIELIADDADVYIYGGYPESKLELVNFKDGSFRKTTANRNITVDTTIDLMSVIRFWESGFSFRGLRNYMHASSSDGSAAKRINVYLPSDSDVNIVNIRLGKGSVYVSNFDTAVDFDITLEEGDAVFTEFRTTSQITAEIETGSLYFRDVYTGILEAVLSDGNITAENFSFGKMNVSGRESSVSLGLSYDMPDFTMNLSARHGEVDLFGEKVDNDYAHEANTGRNAMITVSSGDIIMTREDAPEEPDDEGGASDNTEAGGENEREPEE